MAAATQVVSSGGGGSVDLERIARCYIIVHDPAATATADTTVGFLDAGGGVVVAVNIGEGKTVPDYFDVRGFGRVDTVNVLSNATGSDLTLVVSQ